VRNSLLQRDPSAHVDFIGTVGLITLPIFDRKTLSQKGFQRTRKIGTEDVVCGARNKGQRHGV
jgi:hypothetical protein